MDFFSQQDAARRNTRNLVLLFLAAVLALIVITNVAVAAYLYFSQEFNLVTGAGDKDLAGFLAFFSFARFGMIALGITTTIALVVLYKWMQLSTGGKAVAEGMGGTRISPQTEDRDERRCLNIVQEIALAANMPVPSVYVLNGERGINAFAAGISPGDAVVAVTRGTLTTLKRHELQGVIAHEFSHILNGDMRLNIRLAALLKGITFIGDVGYFLLQGNNRIRAGSNRRSGATMPLLGVVLWLLGLAGEAFAGFIKAAISRQKEYLADASAVQYTRSAEGIGDALKVIGGFVPGSFVHAARASEMSHIFFSQILHPLWHLFPTHPPLAERIRRLDPAWDGRFIERKPEPYGSAATRPGHDEVGVGRAAIVAAAAATVAVGSDEQHEDPPAAAPADAADTPTAEDAAADAPGPAQDIPLALTRQAREPLGAQAIVMALLLSEEQLIKQAQLAALTEGGPRGLSELTLTLHPAVLDLGTAQRLPLLELSLPALKVMSAGQYRNFKRALLQLIQADQKTELYEWCLYQLVRHYLDPEFVRVKPSRPRFRKLNKLAQPLAAVLSVLAYSGGPQPEARFAAAARELEMPRLALLPPAEASVAEFSRAVHTLADCYPLLKPRILKALVSCATGEQGLSPQGREIITSIAAVMDCPVPRLPGDPGPKY